MFLCYDFLKGKVPSMSNITQIFTTKNNKKFFVECKVLKGFEQNSFLTIWLCAKDVNTNKVLGECCFSKENKTSKSVLINNVQILDHSYDNCGIGTTLFTIMENIAFKKLGATKLFLVCAPQKGYEKQAEHFYSKFGFLEVSAFALLCKNLNLKSMHKIINLSGISVQKFVQTKPIKAEDRIECEKDDGKVLYTTVNATSLKKNNHPYYLTGSVIFLPKKHHDFLNASITVIDFFTNKELGECEFAIRKNKTAYLASIEIFNHKYDHCGIGTTLLYAMENFVTDYGVQEISLLCSPKENYEYIVDNFYKKHGYVKPKMHPTLKLKHHPEIKNINFDELDLTDCDVTHEMFIPKEVEETFLRKHA